MFEPRFIAALLNAPPLSFAARILLTCGFWWSGVSKMFDHPSALAEAAHFGLRPAWLFVIVIIVVQLGGSAAVIFSRWTWLGAGALGVFTVAATLVGHAFWTIDDPLARFHDMNAFLGNVGLLGGLMVSAILADHEGRG